MSFSTLLIKLTNRVFPKPVHPFNLQNDGQQSYAQWQYRKGGETVRLFREVCGTDELFLNKKVLDMGCGAAGKSLYYCSLGAKKVIGVDIVGRYKTEAEALAAELGFEERFEFVVGSAFALPFPDSSVDTIIMNDFMEHVSDPEQVLLEACRLISPDGYICVNFPPYYHPYGAHLSDRINMPWVHMFFGEKALIDAYRELLEGTTDAKERLDLRISKDSNGREYFSYINHMTLKKFRSILRETGIVPCYYREIPLRPWLSLPAKLPLVKEMFVKMAVCVIRKQDKAETTCLNGASMQ